MRQEVAQATESPSLWAIAAATVLAAAVWTTLRWVRLRPTAAARADRRRGYWAGVWEQRVQPARRVDVWREMRRREREWADTLGAEQRERVPGDIRKMNYDGEVLFCLLGLKPCVLVAIYGGSRRQPVATEVVDELVQRVLQPTVGRLPGMRLERIGQRLVADNGIDWADAWLLWDSAGPHDALVRATLRDPARDHVTDAEMARALDYPGSSQGDLRVSYVERDPSTKTDRVALQYFASQDELSLVSEHYMRYRKAAEGLMDLVLDIRTMSRP